MLAIASSKDLLEAMLAGLAKPAGAAGARYAAAYRHAQELPNFLKMTRLIDTPLTRETTQDQAEPAFFSGNMASIGQVLARIDSESITVHDSGALVTQSVVYRMK
jgi:hypothetical protein